MSNPIDVNGSNFEEMVLKSKLPVLVDFWAPWCQPCMMMSPILEEIAKEMEGKLVVAKANTEEADCQVLASKYQIMSIPNMKLFKDGQVVGEYIGFRPKESMLAELNKVVG